MRKVRARRPSFTGTCMAYPTPLNSMITDSVTQSSVQVLASAPAMAMGTIYQSAAHSIGILYQNATAAQRQSSICAQAATNAGVMQLYSANSMAAAAATSKISKSSVSRDLLLAVIALQLLK
jgi:hypothetical protein